MESNAEIFAMVMTTIVMSIAGLTAIAVTARIVLARAARNRALMSGSTAFQTDPHADARLQRIEDAVEAIAVEVERISEAQRFTTRVLTERLPDRLPDRLPEHAGDAGVAGLQRRVTTPH